MKDVIEILGMVLGLATLGLILKRYTAVTSIVSTSGKTLTDLLQVIYGQ